jgi:L-asparaginase II
MPNWLHAGATEPVARLVRDNKVESIHHGVLAVVDSHGKKVASAGDPKVAVYPRSTLKPLQTLAVLNTGVELSDVEVALTSASHSGSKDHQDAVYEFLLNHQLSPGLLQCPADWPLDRDERLAMMARGEDKNQLAMNCSGKHTGFLAACQHKGWELDSYLSPVHPLQRAIISTVEEYSGEAPAQVSIDGCGAPLLGLSILGLARAMARLVSEDSAHSRRIVESIGTNAWAIAGHGHANTVVIERLGGIAKIGAEGLVVIAVPSGYAVAVKILDGSMRATTPVALEALRRVGAIDEAAAQALIARTSEQVFGGESLLGGLEVTLG